jgi:hypothetical protein
VRRKRYPRETKSAPNAVNEYDFDKLTGNFISASWRADFLWYYSSKAKTSLCKTSVHLVDELALKVQQGRMASSTSAVHAIPNEELLPGFQKHCINERTVGTLQREPNFGQLRYWFHQRWFLANFARETAGQELSVSQLTRAFDYHPACVKIALANRFEELKSRGRHSGCNDDSEEETMT